MAVGAVASGLMVAFVGVVMVLHWWDDPDFVREAERASVCGPHSGSLVENGGCLYFEPWRVVRAHPSGAGVRLDLEMVDDCCDNGTARAQFAEAGPIAGALRVGDTVNAAGLGYIDGLMVVERNGVTQKTLDYPVGVSDASLARALMVLTLGGVLFASGCYALRNSSPLRVNPAPGPSPRPT
ncbi:hypothetical protein GCM10010329_05590 [Streptomyces spiroverticillatus]|uniref:Uncharacterized protein n=1 Tax=Streptomyces finlayi TaxID=67296 RepID=A0A918WTF6_9ACTN|nr:hypothetical protein GCM10010329_05590 [Streptomyces spiroverticillatus]GHC79386.1 hypothetical protein GCM10010334_05570 [Streptomyces finlayi]